jgi:hypothetical protein
MKLCRCVGARGSVVSWGTILEARKADNLTAICESIV